MLFQVPDFPNPARLQGVFVSDGEIQRLVDYWHLAAAPAQAAAQAEGASLDALPDGIPLRQAPLWGPGAGEDPLLPEAIEIAQKEGRPSITSLQRRFRIGYTRAARLVDVMEQKGIIGPTEGSPVKLASSPPPTPEPRPETPMPADPMLPDAIELVRREKRASVIMLQQRMRVGNIRAARLIDVLEEKGIIGPAQPNTEVREVLDYGSLGPSGDD
jgi:DNA segregation ATPase FtsK/SpoIIIE-like protein